MLIGRANEIQTLRRLLQSGESELLLVYGRRRVGKTFLIKETYRENMVFDFTGTQNGELDSQLQKFSDKLSRYMGSPRQKQPENWSEAFQRLRHYLSELPKSKRKKKPVIFFDEMPWIATRKSKFLEEFAYWWNDWANWQNIVVVICGSAASWMIQKIINNKGGLYNRVTERIHLKPFTLSETRAFLTSKKIALSDYALVELYMALGGIPQYLKGVRKGESISQTIDRLCFSKDGSLRNEFENLFAALFENHENHLAIIKALGKQKQGLNRNDLLKKSKMSNGGGATKVLQELEASSFIERIEPLQNSKKQALYRLIDEYSLFYLRFIEKSNDSTNWMQLATTNGYKIWRGYAFENICLRHVEAIKAALGISGVFTTVSSYFFKGNAATEGFQIDLLIDRADNAINLCEIKFYNTEFKVNKQMADKLRRRREQFRKVSKSKKLLFNTLITTFGIETNEHSLGQVDQQIEMGALFALGSFQ